MSRACSEFGFASVPSSPSPTTSHPTRIVIGGVQYDLRKLVGEGGFAFVYQASARGSTENCAVKRFVVQEGAEESVKQEVLVQKRLSPHANIVCYLDHVFVPKREGAACPELFVAMEFCDGSLTRMVNDHIANKTEFPDAEVVKVVSHLVNALAHMHSQSPPITHRDLKIENVLFANGQFKLADFGSATTYYFEPKTSQQIAATESEVEETMTAVYRPPESHDLWSKKARLDTKMDIWALGIVLYVLLFLRMPFNEASPRQILTLEFSEPLPSNDVVKARFSQTRGALFQLMRRLLTVNPAERPDIFEVSKFVSEIDPSHQPIAVPTTVSPQLSKF